MTYSVFDISNTTNHMQAKMFFGQPVTIARYDQQKYPFLEKLIEKQLSFFWLPQEVDLIKDSKDFKQLTPPEQHIFTSNLKRQILLDSVQGRSPSVAFMPIISLPELETWVQTWAANETIHSRSYTHIIRNIYAHPSEVFDEITSIQEIVDCAKDISANYDVLIEANNKFALDGGWKSKADERAHKKTLWKALVSVNILEGVRFYVSFACSWAFAEMKKLEGNAKVIRFIARDEAVHLAGTQQLLKLLPRDDPDFVEIAEECRDDCVTMFISAVDQEKTWANYLFKDGSMIGLNEQLLSDYIEWIAHKRMTAIGLKGPYKGGSNPLPWTQSWISSAEVQEAPQEVNISTYTIGAIKKDVDGETFSGFKL